MERRLEMFIWHHASANWEHLTIPGVELYSQRALVMNGEIAVIKKDDSGGLPQYLHYLCSVGIGPKTVIELSGNLYQPNMELHDRLAEEKRRQGRIGLQLFHNEQAEAQLLEELGLGWDSVKGLQPETTVEANNKLKLRQLGEKTGWDGFPYFRFCSERRDVIGAVRFLQRNGQEAIIKVPDLASGDGMSFVSTPEQAEKVADSMLEQAGGDLIVEVAYRDHVPMSIQWELTPAGSRLVCVSAQIIDRDGKTHRGNVVASGDRGLPNISQADVAKMVQVSLPYVRYYGQNEISGRLGFDFLKTRAGEVFMLECNGRVMASTYADAVGRQVAPRLGNNWAVAMAIVAPTQPVADFDALTKLLGQRLYWGKTGILPFLTCLLPSKIGLMSIHHNATAATQLLTSVGQDLGVQ